MQYTWKIDENQQIKLKDFDPDYHGKNIDKTEGEKKLQDLCAELSELQEMLAAAHQQSVLVVLQGTDTAGKDGTIRHVFSQINPQGCQVWSFKQPTPEELDHDFLWRVHHVTPGKGSFGIFNRSHYEDVLVVRVHKLAPEEVWRGHYAEINHFEKLLADNGTIILKFFLHISASEQEERLLAREKDRDKAWKLSASDWADRPYWDAYQDAYADMLTKCSTSWAPWHVIPANHKWFRNLAIAQTLVETLRPYKKVWAKDLQKRGQKELDLLKHVPHP